MDINSVAAAHTNHAAQLSQSVTRHNALSRCFDLPAWCRSTADPAASHTRPLQPAHPCRQQQRILCGKRRKSLRGTLIVADETSWIPHLTKQPSTSILIKPNKSCKTTSAEKSWRRSTPASPPSLRWAWRENGGRPWRICSTGINGGGGGGGGSSSSSSSSITTGRTCIRSLP